MSNTTTNTATKKSTEPSSEKSDTSEFNICNEKMLTCNEIADMFRIERCTVYTYAKKGFIPKPVSIAGVRLWRLSEINKRLIQDNPHLKNPESTDNQREKTQKQQEDKDEHNQYQDRQNSW